MRPGIFGGHRYSSIISTLTNISLSSHPTNIKQKYLEKCYASIKETSNMFENKNLDTLTLFSPYHYYRCAMHSIMKWIRYDQQFFSSCCNDLGLWKNWSNILYVANILGLLLRLEQKLFISQRKLCTQCKKPGTWLCWLNNWCKQDLQRQYKSDRGVTHK